MLLGVGSNIGQWLGGMIISTMENLYHTLYSFSPRPFIKIISSQLLSIYLLLLIITLSMINSLESNLTPDLFRRSVPSLGTVGLL